MANQPATLVVDRIAQEARDELVAPRLPENSGVEPGEMSPPGLGRYQPPERPRLPTTPPRSREGGAGGRSRTPIRFSN